MTEGISNLFDRIASILLKVPEKDLSENDKGLVHRLVNEAWDHGKLNGDYVSQFMKVACRDFGDLYHIPSVEEVGLIQGLIQLWANYSGGSPWISHAGPGMAHGVYDHFKGGQYLSQRVERCADTGESRVSYLSLLHGTPHSRRAAQWNEIVKWPDGEYRSRFVYRGPDLLTPPPPFKVPSPTLFWEGRMGMTS